MEAKVLLFSTILIFAYVSFPVYSWDDDECTYVIYVQTGNAKSATTYAKVNLELRDKYFNRLNITNLQSWGIMSKYHYYFKRGNLDTFAVKGKCLKGPICSMTLSHDNTGVSPGWYVDYVEVTSIAPSRGCRKINFPVNAWLAINEPPFGTASRGVYLCDDIIGDDGKCS
ncbi:PLAT domain-containing protein 3-like [Chenopodium quinoa]|nr:PLAT domain-containing protein 3-like [Chenopodium quinoa]